MENQINNENQNQFQPGVFTQTISTEQIKRIKWKTYFWSFALPLWLIHLGIVALFAVFYNTSFKINNKEINFFLLMPTISLKAWLILAAVFLLWTIWPLIITIKFIFFRPYMPKLWTSDMLIAITNLKSEYRKHCYWFAFFFALPFLFLYFRKFLIFRRKEKK